MEEEKKKSNIREFFGTYGIPLLIVIATIVALIIFSPIKEVDKSCVCEKCNLTISLSNYSVEDGQDITCCVNATWDDKKDECDYTYLTKNIKFEVNRT